MSDLEIRAKIKKYKESGVNYFSVDIYATKYAKCPTWRLTGMLFRDIAKIMADKINFNENKYRGKLGGLQTKIYHLEHKPFSEADCARRGEQIERNRIVDLIERMKNHPEYSVMHNTKDYDNGFNYGYDKALEELKQRISQDNGKGEGK